MIEWSEQHLLIRDMVRRFIDAEIKPRHEELEHGDLPPYDILRKMMKTFGLDEAAKARFKKRIEQEQAAGNGQPAEAPSERRMGDADGAAMQLIPIIELCRWCPGMVTAMGVSVGLLPAKGMTLPFISSGGSSIVSVFLLVGMLLALTRRRPDALRLRRPQFPLTSRDLEQLGPTTQ